MPSHAWLHPPKLVQESQTATVWRILPTLMTACLDPPPTANDHRPALVQQAGQRSCRLQIPLPTTPILRTRREIGAPPGAGVHAAAQHHHLAWCIGSRRKRSPDLLIEPPHTCRHVGEAELAGTMGLPGAGCARERLR